MPTQHVEVGPVSILAVLHQLGEASRSTVIPGPVTPAIIITAVFIAIFVLIGLVMPYRLVIAVVVSIRLAMPSRRLVVIPSANLPGR